MKLKDKFVIYLIISVLFLAFLYSIKSILSPFIVAVVLAYFLDPLADRLEKFGFSRIWATTIIWGSFLVSITLLLVLLLPLLYGQMVSLFAAIPGYVNVAIENFYPRAFSFATKYGIDLEPDFRSYFSNQTISDIFSLSGNIVSNVMQSGIVLVNILSLIFITPILVFYMLRDWDLLINKINHYLPANYKKDIRGIFKDIDRTLSGYVHGQFNVCIILGIFYALGLSLVSLNFGFLVGFLTGIFSFIPYVGMLFGVLIAIFIGLFQWGIDSLHIGLVALVFLIGQILESNFLTPNLVGGKIGLHPVWIIFGVFVFGVLFGFFGILFAMPLTAICGVIIKFIVLQYKKNFVD
ncbi:MAG: perM [Rickettsiaceae bacterium]|jgi:predicted PurR-regulated permease PerM|nr:perM [Rickettsiaceae bacterium]